MKRRRRHTKRFDQHSPLFATRLKEMTRDLRRLTTIWDLHPKDKQDLKRSIRWINSGKPRDWIQANQVLTDTLMINEEKRYWPPRAIEMLRGVVAYLEHYTIT